MRRAAIGALSTVLVMALGVGVPAAAQSDSSALVNAARDGDVATVQALLAGDADANTALGDGLTALHQAAAYGRADVAEALIAAGADLEAATRIGSYTPLHLAARGAHAAVVRHLVAAGANVEAVTSTSGVSPLHLAAAAIDGAEVVEALLADGADPNARESSAGQTPLMFAAGANRAESAKALLQGGADARIATRVIDVLPSLALDREASRRLREKVSELAGVDPDPDADVDRRGRRDPETPRVELTSAQVQAAIQAQREFLQSGYDVGEVDAHSLARLRSDYPGGPDVVRPPYREVLVGRTGGMTPLLYAARDGNIEAAVSLLEWDADLNQVSADETSPLAMSLLNGQFDMALLLIERGADPNFKSSTEGLAPLFAVLQTQWAPRSNYPQPRAHDQQQAQHLEVLEALLEAGADPNVRLNTHLWYWEYGLMKMGIDVTGATPFWRAAFAQDLPAMKLLVAHGADPNIPTRWPEVGMRERRQEDGRQQEDSGLPYIPEGASNAWPLHAAAGGGYLGLGAFSVRNTPNQFLPAVKYLVEEHGADVNLSDSWGYRPLHYAASRGDNEMIGYLVSQGADVMTLTRLGQSTADMARGGRAGFFTRVPYPETVELLTGLGSTLECLNTHFLDTGDVCEGAGVNDVWAAPPADGHRPAGIPRQQ